MHDLEQLIQQAENDLSTVVDAVQLQQVRAHYLGKKGQVTALMKGLAGVPADQRRQLGQAINQAKQRIQDLAEQCDTAIKQAQLQAKLASETIDVSLPGRAQLQGSLHPVTLVRQRIEAFFTSIGFNIAEGPEVEDDYHNFTALNIPDHHPAKAEFDTFYFPDGRLLRTHTSPVQVRVMQQQSPPIRVIAPGRVYRCDSDATHAPMFNQVEGLMIDRNISFANLKAILQDFLNAFFETEVEMRLRPAYFPFTEPSAEVDMRWGDNDWLEILGCGMVHPNVLAQAGIDSEEYSGFAFGMGMDRLAMLRYGITDLRTLFDNDIRFLQQFK